MEVVMFGKGFSKAVSVLVVFALVLLCMPQDTLAQSQEYVEQCAAALGITVGEVLVMIAMLGFGFFYIMYVYYGIFEAGYLAGYEDGVHDVPLTQDQWDYLNQDPAAAAMFCQEYPSHTYCQ